MFYILSLVIFILSLSHTVFSLDWIQTAQSSLCSITPGSSTITLGIDLIAPVTGESESPVCFVIRRGSNLYGHFRYTATDTVTLYLNCDSTCRANCTVFRRLYRYGSSVGSSCDARYRLISNVTSVSSMENLRPIGLGDGPGMNRSWASAAFYRTNDCSGPISYVEIFSDFGTCKPLNSSLYVHTDHLLGYYATYTCGSASCQVGNCTLRGTQVLPDSTRSCSNGSIVIPANLAATGLFINPSPTPSQSAVTDGADSSSSSSSSMLGIGAILGICAAILILATGAAVYYYRRSNKDAEISLTSLFQSKRAKEDPPPAPPKPKIIVAEPVSPPAQSSSPSMVSSPSPLLASDNPATMDIQSPNVFPSQSFEQPSPQVRNRDSIRQSIPSTSLPQDSQSDAFFGSEQSTDGLEHSSTVRSSIISLMPPVSYVSSDPRASYYQPIISADGSTSAVAYSPVANYNHRMSFVPMANTAMVGMYTPEGYIVPVMVPSANPLTINSTQVVDLNAFPPAYEEVASESQSSHGQQQQQGVNADVKVPIPTLEEVERQISYSQRISTPVAEASSSTRETAALSSQIHIPHTQSPVDDDDDEILPSP